MKAKLFFIAFLCSLPTFFFSQNDVYKQGSIAKATEYWKLVTINNSNTLNGVQIFSYDTQCGTEKITLVKLINSNSFPVRFSYQLSSTRNTEDVIVPAYSTLEGSCSATEANILKLKVVLPIGSNDEETKKNIEFALSHIFISEIK